jgi:hypothetical protein
MTKHHPTRRLSVLTKILFWTVRLAGAVFVGLGIYRPEAFVVVLGLLIIAAAEVAKWRLKGDGWD